MPGHCGLHSDNAQWLLATESAFASRVIISYTRKSPGCRIISAKSLWYSSLWHVARLTDKDLKIVWTDSLAKTEVVGHFIQLSCAFCKLLLMLTEIFKFCACCEVTSLKNICKMREWNSCFIQALNMILVSVAEQGRHNVADWVDESPYFAFSHLTGPICCQFAPPFCIPLCKSSPRVSNFLCTSFRFKGNAPLWNASNITYWYYRAVWEHQSYFVTCCVRCLAFYFIVESFPFSLLHLLLLQSIISYISQNTLKGRISEYVAFSCRLHIISVGCLWSIENISLSCSKYLERCSVDSLGIIQNVLFFSPLLWNRSHTWHIVTLQQIIYI